MRSLRVDISWLEDKKVSAQTTKRFITSSRSKPLLRRLVITLQRLQLLGRLRKAFDTILRETLLQKLCNIGISETFLEAIMRLYESVLGCLGMAHNLVYFC
jgi:hypothetical protein